MYTQNNKYILMASWLQTNVCEKKLGNRKCTIIEFNSNFQDFRDLFICIITIYYEAIIIKEDNKELFLPQISHKEFF